MSDRMPPSTWLYLLDQITDDAELTESDAVEIAAMLKTRAKRCRDEARDAKRDGSSGLVYRHEADAYEALAKMLSCPESWIPGR